mgnify:CR=1 FL=1
MRDPTYDKEDAEAMARELRAFYSRWPQNIKIWIEQDSHPVGTGRRYFYSIRSNIEIKLPA